MYVQGRGWRLGLALGEARERDKRNQQYDEDRLRALSEHLEARARDLEEREKVLGEENALRDRNLNELGQIEQEALAGAGGLPPGIQGPPTPEASRMQGYFERLKDMAGRMKPENRPQYLIDERARADKRAFERARQKVVASLQDKLADGGFNFTGESEISPEIAEDIEALMVALDSPDVDPVAATAHASDIAAKVHKENERRLAKKDMSEMLQGDIAAAKATGNEGLMRAFRRLQVLWEGGDITGAQLVAASFQLQNPESAEEMRKAAREEYERDRVVRSAAVKIWQDRNPEAEDLPTEEELAQIEALLVPPAKPTGPLPFMFQEFHDQRAKAGSVSRGTPTEEAPRATTGTARPDMDLIGRSPELDKAMGVGAAPQAAQARPWAKLKPKEQKDAEASLLALAAKAERPGEAVRAALAELGIDPESVPQAIRKKIAAATKKKKGPTLGETVSRLRPGAGGM